MRRWRTMSTVHPPRVEALVDLNAIRHNVQLLAGTAARHGAQTMAVVKADGYGHGAVAVARAALAAGATWLGVCTIEEAIELRAAGITAPVLSWLHTPDEDFTAALEADVDLSVASRRSLDAVVAAARGMGCTARVHLKVDTGLSRGGAQPADWDDVVDHAAKAAADGAIDVVSVWSHLAHADAPEHPTIDKQAARFDEAYRRATAAGLRPLRHLANSAATLTRPDLHLDLVRPGIAVYGLSPVPERGGFGLEPAMTFRSRVMLVKRVPAGEGVSYGHTWTTSRLTRLALVPVGYADGVPRGLSGRLTVLVNGSRRAVVGRVCMDQVVVDCGDADVVEGDEVVFFGPGHRGEPTAQDWADALDTIHYEIVTGIVRPRVTRTIIGDGA
jgi:alanine racemase